MALRECCPWNGPPHTITPKAFRRKFSYSRPAPILVGEAGVTHTPIYSSYPRSGSYASLRHFLPSCSVRGSRPPRSIVLHSMLLDV